MSERRDVMIADVRKLAIMIKRIPMNKDMRHPVLKHLLTYKIEEYQEEFANKYWIRILEKMGIFVKRSDSDISIYARNALIHQLRVLSKSKLGGAIPTEYDVNTYGEKMRIASYKTFVEFFGTFENALIAASPFRVTIDQSRKE